MREALNDFKSYHIFCTSKAQQKYASEEITNNNVELLLDYLRVLKEHEDEIRKIRQELEIQMQKYKINKLIELEK